MSFFDFQPTEWDDDPKHTIDFRGFNPSKMGPRRLTLLRTLLFRHRRARRAMLLGEPGLMVDIWRFPKWGCPQIIPTDLFILFRGTIWL